MAAAYTSATLADPPPKPPPDKPLPDKPRPAEHLFQSSSTTAADLGQTSQSSSPASDGPSMVTGNSVLQHAPMAGKSRLQSLPSEAAVDNNLGQTFKPSSPATTMHSQETRVHAPVPGNNIKQSMASKPSFAEVTKQGSSINKRKSAPELHMFGQPMPLPGAKIISENGVDILMFEDETTDLLAASLKWALVGKFSHNLPRTHTVGKFLSNLNLRGEFEIKWLSHRQILIVLTEEEDYALIWTKGFWVIDGCPMRALKWTPTFNARTECPFAPVWASLPGLPVHLFEKRALYLIANQLGRPVMVDDPTATRKRASLARICVEINLLSPIKDALNLSINGHLVQQPIIYEDLPRYCSHCSHIGHTVENCFVKNVDLKTGYDKRRAVKKRKTVGKEKVKWVMKEHSGSANNPVIKEGNVVKDFDGVLGDDGLSPIEPTVDDELILHGKPMQSTVHQTNPPLQLHANSTVQSMQVAVHNSEVGDVVLVGSVDPASVSGLLDSGKGACTANKEENVIGGNDMQSVNSENLPDHASKSGGHAEMCVDEVNSNFGVSAIEEGEFIAADLESTLPVHTGYLRDEHAMVDPNGHNHGSNNLHDTVVGHNSGKDQLSKIAPVDDGVIMTDSGANGNGLIVGDDVGMTIPEELALSPMTSAVNSVGINPNSLGLFYVGPTTVSTHLNEDSSHLETHAMNPMTSAEQFLLNNVLAGDPTLHDKDEKGHAVVDGDVGMQSAALIVPVQPSFTALHGEGGSGHDVLNTAANDINEQEEFIVDIAGLFAQTEDNSYDTAMVLSTKTLNNNSKILGPNLTEFTHIPAPGPTTKQILDLMISNINKNNPNFDPMNVECKLADMFPEPLQTIYPEDEYYSDEHDKLREWVNQESPRSDDDESSEIDNFDDFDDYFEKRIFPRVRSELNLGCNAGYDDAACNSGYGGRVTRSMARNGRAKV